MDFFKRIKDLSAIYDDDGSSSTVLESRPMFNDGGRLGFEPGGKAELVPGMRYDNLPDSTQNKIIELSKTKPTAEIARDLQNELPPADKLNSLSRTIKNFLKKRNIEPLEQLGGSSMPIEERLAKEKIITDFIKKNPDITNADAIAKSINASNSNLTMSPNFVKAAFKRLGLDDVLTSRHAEIFPQIEKLDKILKKNKKLLNGNLAPEVKKNRILQIYAKETNQSLDEAAANLKSRLTKLGKLYAGEEQRYEKKLYSKIKIPTNYMDSSFHKNLISIADRAGMISNIDMARLLGLPKKQIDLIQGTANMMNAFDFKVAGDHTDIKALMKNFPDYKKNFTRIEYIKDNLNEYKRSYDRKILSLSKQAKGASPSVQQELLKQQKALQNDFANKTGYKIGGFDITKGRVTISPQTLRLPDLKNPYNDTLQTAMKNFSQTGLPGKKGTTFDQIDQRLINANPQERIDIFEEIKGTPEAKQSKYLKALQKIPKIGKLATAVIGGTAGAAGVSTLANAADGTEATSILPEAAAGTAAAGTAFKYRKPITKVAKKVIPKILAPLGIGLEGYFAKQGYDQGRTIPEIAAAPFMLEGFVSDAQERLRMSPAERQALNRQQIAQDFSGMDSDFATPYIKGSNEVDVDAARLRAQREEALARARRAQQRQGIITQGLAGGGIAKMAGDRSGAMTRSMNPDSQGLSYLFNRVKKV
jgi:hypothetical protein